jgi:hypothetical protein
MIGKELLLMQSLTVPCYLVSLTPKYLPQHPIFETTSAYVPPSILETLHVERGTENWEKTTLKTLEYMTD